MLPLRPETKIDALRALNGEHVNLSAFARAMWRQRGANMNRGAGAVLGMLVREGLAAREGRGPRARYSLTDQGRAVLERGLPRESGGTVTEPHAEGCGCFACVPPLVPERPAWRPPW
jgi:predicted transcriptional regulator